MAYFFNIEEGSLKGTVSGQGIEIFLIISNNKKKLDCGELDLPLHRQGMTGGLESGDCHRNSPFIPALPLGSSVPFF